DREHSTVSLELRYHIRDAAHQEHAKESPSGSCHFGCWFWRLPPHVGIQMQVVRKDAGQSRHLLSVVKVVLHLPPEECRTQTPRPLALPPLQNRTSAG